MTAGQPVEKYVYTLRVAMPTDKYFPETGVLLGSGVDGTTFSATETQYESLKEQIQKCGGVILLEAKLSPVPPPGEPVLNSQPEAPKRDHA